MFILTVRGGNSKNICQTMSDILLLACKDHSRGKLTIAHVAAWQR